jgi:hypothetical protein
MVSQGVFSHLLRNVQPWRFLRFVETRCCIFSSRNCVSVVWASTIRRCNFAALRKAKNSGPSGSILSGGRNASASAGSSTKTSSPGCLERDSGSSLFFPETYSTTKLNRFNSMAHRVIFPRSSSTLSSQVRVSLSVRRVKRLSSNNGRYFLSAHIHGKAFLLVGVVFRFGGCEFSRGAGDDPPIAIVPLLLKYGTHSALSCICLQEETLCWVCR